MKTLIIAAVLVLTFAGIANAQKTVTGKVLEYSADYDTITVEVGDKLKAANVDSYGVRSVVVFTKAFGAYGCTPKTCKFKAPKISGPVRDAGQDVLITYTRIISEHGFGYVLVASKIVALGARSSVIDPAEISEEQIKSVTGTVLRYESGNRWGGIVVKVGNKEYWIQTFSVAAPADPNQEVEPTPDVVGEPVDGALIKIFYKSMDADVIQAIKIVVIKEPK